MMQSKEWYEKFMDSRETDEAPIKEEVQLIMEDMKEVGLIIPCKAHGSLDHADATARAKAFYVILNAIRKQDRDAAVKKKFEKMGFTMIPLDSEGIESAADLLDAILGGPGPKQDK